MGRYTDIRRGVELNAALTKLRAYEDLSTDAKQAAYKAQRGNSVKVKPNKTKGFVESFNLTGRIYLPVRLLSETQTTNGTLISLVRTASATTGRTVDVGFTVPAGGVVLDGLTGFKAARFGAVQRGAAVADNKSRLTDIEYSRYDNKSVSSPFGSEQAGSETYPTAVAAIRALAAVETFVGTTGNRIYFTPEII
ncbi:hypothetical protein [Dolichospermum sp. UHCC 0259]|uniref:hypothetical protein n=1 Tax=Dolichospermum sp. UHCC 0259 TaxID=2590010 RepID=UPI0014467614|nr:hypothetical protein [Dolichospermum sp. UHCC 0259]MTJ50905.1 hypothetical protein [Dolichospermum sp. UHCC 0259]